MTNEQAANDLGDVGRIGDCKTCFMDAINRIQFRSGLPPYDVAEHEAGCNVPLARAAAAAAEGA